MRCIIFFLTVSALGLNAQDYAVYRMRYDHYEEGDSTAFRHVRPYIAKAKRENNYRELSQAYKDAVSFSPDRKIEYADSMIWAASQSRNKEVLANAYLTKGTVYYFNYRKFKPALEEYLKAWKYSQHSEDQYLYYKNLYHIGVVKSYLGYYGEALDIFLKCSFYFSRPQVQPEPANINFNRKKGYLNTLHQTGICLIHLNRLPEAEQLLKKAFAESGAEADFYLERSYFYKLQGIIAYQQKNYSAATSLLTTSLAGLEKKNDFTNASIAYFYKGKSEQRLSNTERAVYHFVKIDSVFRSHAFVLPEVRASYEFLINYYHGEGHREQELYYTTQLLKADRIISADFKYLSGRIFREYDTEDLLAAKKRLETSVPYFYVMIAILLAASGGLSVHLYRKKKKEETLSRKYLNLLAKTETLLNSQEEQPQAVKRVSKISSKSSLRLLQKLQTFENNRFFLEKGLTRHQLAENLETNESYLSQVINTYKGNNFNGYINQLRIAYITVLLRESNKYRSYKTEALAEECGFSDRAKFTRAFTEVNGMSPSEMIRQIEADLFEM
ncbi:AraC family transcriptional regulator [Chryseobacterium sp. MDT2-18]|uniref:helix-turn-helix domain-containing protein n=1 Tax=Chryseobacterium sp. MDT2-18 TaxID=1259136 RepID=UPI002780873D|nr:AraC family transcriptional regulator [Chryseobacterium sp. MDT2-18]MDQ0477459.1 AraC-like DNA-binding protein/tetratricopeptide (TPR) repeat protein [Chryseobacterium sp. MDT2-18]